jgi:hypothetical protein
MERNDSLPAEEARDSVAPQPEGTEPADAGGDSPGPGMGVPDRPAGSDRHGTTASEQGEQSLERRLAMERSDTSAEEPPEGSRREPGPIVDDDVPAEDAGVEVADFQAEDADLDRTRSEVGEESIGDPGEGPEEGAMHVEE